eukprot:2971346-Amphidinium_carterae.3
MLSCPDPDIVTDSSSQIEEQAEGRSTASVLKSSLPEGASLSSRCYILAAEFPLRQGKEKVWHFVDLPCRAVKKLHNVGAWCSCVPAPVI